MSTRRGKVFELRNGGNSFVDIVVYFISLGSYDSPVG